MHLLGGIFGLVWPRGLPASCGWWASVPLFWDVGQNPDLESELGYDPKRPRIPHPLAEFPVVM